MTEKPKLDLGLTGYDDLFKDDKEIREGKLPRIHDIPTELIDDFPNHPFKVKMDDDMEQLVESVKERGLITPITLRPKENGRYEIVSGHRRKKACEIAGLSTVKADVREMSRDEAIIMMVESNLQRSVILPSEKAFSYKMRLEAMKRQGMRTDLTSAQVAPKLSTEVIGESAGMSKDSVKRYIRLTYLIEPIQQMVDGTHEYNMRMAFNPATEISFLKPEEQEMLYQAMLEMQATPSLMQAQQLKKRSQEGKLDESFIDGILASEKPNQKEKLSFKSDEIDYFFPKTYTPKQKKDVIIKLLSAWNKKREVER